MRKSNRCSLFITPVVSNLLLKTCSLPSLGVIAENFIVSDGEWPSLHVETRYLPCIALYRKFETNIPRNETARPRPQFLHPCICERFINSHDRSANQYRNIGGRIVGIYKSLTGIGMQKLGMTPRSFISGNIYFEPSVQCDVIAYT